MRNKGYPQVANLRHELKHIHDGDLADLTFFAQFTKIKEGSKWAYNMIVYSQNTSLELTITENLGA